jgi:hypothetical protein
MDKEIMIQDVEAVLIDAFNALKNLPIEFSPQLDGDLLDMLKKAINQCRSAQRLYKFPPSAKIEFGKRYKVKFGEKPETYAVFVPLSDTTVWAVWQTVKGLERARSAVNVKAAEAAIIEEVKLESEATDE